MARINITPAAPVGSLFVKTSSTALTNIQIRTPAFTGKSLYQLTIVRGLRDNQRITGYFTSGGRILNQVGALVYLGKTSNGDQVYRSSRRLRAASSSGATKIIDIGETSG